MSRIINQIKVRVFGRTYEAIVQVVDPIIVVMPSQGIPRAKVGILTRNSRPEPQKSRGREAQSQDDSNCFPRAH